MLKKTFVIKNIEPVLDLIDNKEIKNKVKKFLLQDTKSYIANLKNLNIAIKNQKLSLAEAYKRGTPLSDEIISKASQIESLVHDKVTIKKIKDFFRSLCADVIYKGKIVKRGFEKPRGYAGDYQMIEYIYDNKGISDDIGYCCDMYFLNNKYAIAVRNRKDMMKEILIQYVSNNTTETVDILNLACGSCREISEMLSSYSLINKDINYTLVDYDNEALAYSKNMLSPFVSKRINFKYLQHNILRYSREPDKYSNILGNYNLVYSVGLADYLPDNILKNLISFCYNLLKPGGTLILAHKDIKMYKPVDIDWWCDWTFYPRTQNDLLNLMNTCGIANLSFKIEREQSNIIIFLSVRKNKL